MLMPFDQLFARYKMGRGGVLHLGANTGQEAAMYDKLSIHRVVWVEALPDVYAQLVKNIARYPRQFALCACLGDEDEKEVTFHRANNGSQSSSYLELGTHAQEHPTTKFVEDIKMTTRRADTLLATYPVGPGWFLNVDVQGAELMVLKGMGDLLKEFAWVYVEVNIRELYVGCPLVAEIDDYLAKFDFIGMETKMMKQGWGDKLYKRSDI
jgi:FkbM family methyltransferase